VNTNNEINYQYTVNSMNNPMDISLFGINKTTDCLSIKQIGGLNRYSMAGVHTMNITLNDKLNRYDSLICNVFVSETCREQMVILIKKDLQLVNNQTMEYTA
jgi:hypothetical protein